MALGKVVLLRPDVPRREEQDAPAPHRVLDGRAGGRLRQPRRHDGPGRAVGRVGGGARARQAAAGARPARARHVEARDGDDAVPAHLVHRGHRAPEGRGPAGRVGRRLRRHRRDGALGAVRPSGARAPLSGRGQGVLHEARPGAAGPRALRGHARARGLRRDHRRRAASRRLRPAPAAHQGTRACPRKRSSGTWTCAGTDRCRTPGSAWASSAWSAGSAASSTCARRFRTRACCTGCIRSAVHGHRDWGFGRGYPNVASIPRRSPGSRIPTGIGINEDRTDFPRLPQEPRRLRGDARARRTCRARNHRRRGRGRRASS